MCLLTIVAQIDLVLYQIDVKTAFLNGDLHEYIFIKVPDGVKTRSKQNIFCKLKKSFYGTKQAFRCWNLNLNGFLCEELGFEKNTHDPSLYVKESSFGNLAMLALYVDNLLISASSSNDFNWVKRKMSSCLDMKTFGGAKLCFVAES